MDRRPPPKCGSGRASKGKHEVERTASAHSTIHRDVAPMLLHDALTNKEAKTHTGESPDADVRAAVKARENLRSIACRDPEPLIGHVDPPQPTPPRDRDPDLAVLGAQLHGVPDHIFED